MKKIIKIASASLLAALGVFSFAALTAGQSIPTINPWYYFGGSINAVRTVSTTTQVIIGASATTTTSKLETPSLTVTGAAGSGTRCAQFSSLGVLSANASGCGGGGGGSSASGTAGLIQLADGAGAFDSNFLFAFNQATNRLIIGSTAAPSTTLHVVGAATITGSSTLAGTSHTFLSNSGNTMLSGSLNVGATSTLVGTALTFLSNSGATMLGSTLNVTGKSTLAAASTTALTASGDINGGANLLLTGSATVGGQAILTSGLSAATTTVTGTSTLAGVSATFLSNSGASMLTGTLNVAGKTTLANASGTALTLSGALVTSITGSTQCLHVDTNGTVSGTGSDCGSGSVSLTAASTTQVLINQNGSIASYSPFTYASGTQILSFVNASSTNLSASGFVNGGSLSISGASILSGGLTVTGTSTLAGTALTFLSNSGDSMLSGTLNVAGKATLANASGTALTLSGDLNLSTACASGEFLTTSAGAVSCATPSGGGGGGTPGGSTTQVQFNSAGTFAGDAGFTYSSSTDTGNIGILGVGTTAVPSSTLHVVGTATVTGSSTLAGVGLTFLTNSGASMLQGVSSTNVSASGFLNGATLSVSGAAILGSTLNVTGKTTLAAASTTALTASGDINGGANFLLTSNATIGGTLGVTGKSTLANVSSTAITATGALVFSNYGAGLLHSTSGGVITSSAVALGGSDVSGQLPLANGGTNANLTATNNRLFYSTASAGALSGSDLTYTVGSQLLTSASTTVTGHLIVPNGSTVTLSSVGEIGVASTSNSFSYRNGSEQAYLNNTDCSLYYAFGTSGAQTFRALVTPKAVFATSTITAIYAVNGGTGDTTTFSLYLSSNRSTATTSMRNVFSAYQTVTATTTASTLTANGSTTIATDDMILIDVATASTTDFGVTICKKLAQ